MPEPQELKEFLAWQPVLPKDLLGTGVMIEQGAAILYGRYKAFKSMLLLRSTYALSGGKVWIPGYPSHKDGGTILYIQHEISHPSLHGRALPMWQHFWVNGNNSQAPADAPRGKVVVWTEPNLKLDTDLGRGLFLAQVEKWKPDLTILDPLYRGISGGLLNDQAVTRYIDTVDKARFELGTAILIGHHARKPPSGEDKEATSYANTDDMFGMGMLSWWPDTVISVSRKGGDALLGTLSVRTEVTRHAKEEISEILIRFNRHNLQFEMLKGSK